MTPAAVATDALPSLLRSEESETAALTRSDSADGEASQSSSTSDSVAEDTAAITFLSNNGSSASASASPRPSLSLSAASARPSLLVIDFRRTHRPVGLLYTASTKTCTLLRHDGSRTTLGDCSLAAARGLDRNYAT